MKSSKPATLRIMFGVLLCAATIVSCHKKESNPVAPSGNEIPDGIARISGTVHDASGTPLANVFLHVVYELPAPTAVAADVQSPSYAVFTDMDQTLTTDCGGTTPIADGVMIKIFWDRNGNGVDATDPQPPLCSGPPDCTDGPAGTVNLTEFPINSAESDLPAGQFYMSTGFRTVGDVLNPNRFYCRIYCADGNVLYTSNVVDVPGGYSEIPLHFDCTQCTGAPVIPQWHLDSCYPNPTEDSLTVSMILQQSAQTLVTLTRPYNGRVDTLDYEQIGSGGKIFSRVLGTRPNGLYTVRMYAGGFQAQTTVLKNVTDSLRLQSTQEAVASSDSGTFTFDATAGLLLARRGARGEALGNVTLTNIKIFAIRNELAIAETTFVVVGGHAYSLDLAMHAR